MGNFTMRRFEGLSSKGVFGKTFLGMFYIIIFFIPVLIISISMIHKKIKQIDHPRVKRRMFTLFYTTVIGGVLALPAKFFYDNQFYERFGDTGAIIYTVICISLLAFVISYFLKYLKKDNGEGGVIDYKEVKTETRRNKNLKVTATVRKRNPLISPKPPKDSVYAAQVSRNVWVPYPTLSRHLLHIGGSGTGKTVAVIMGLILDTTEASMLVFDPKGEIKRAVEKHLSSIGYNIISLDLNRGTGHSYDLLGKCKTPDEVSSLCDSIIKSNMSGDDETWGNLSRSLLEVGAFYAWGSKNSTLSDVADFIAGINPNDLKEIEKKLLLGTIEEPIVSGKERKGILEARDALNRFKQNAGADGMVSSIFGTINSMLDVFRLDSVRKFQQGSFDITKSRTEKMAIFLSYPEDDSELYKPMLAPLFGDLIGSLKNDPQMDEGSPDALKDPNYFLFILDEFANAGKIPNFENYLTSVRSKDMAFLLFIQDFNQLEKVYGKTTSDVITGTGTTTKIVYGEVSGASAKLASSLIGEEEKGHHLREIFTEDKLRRLDYESSLITVGSLKTIKDYKNYFFLSAREQYILSKLAPFMDYDKLLKRYNKLKDFVNNKLKKDKNISEETKELVDHTIDTMIEQKELDKQSSTEES